MSFSEGSQNEAEVHNDIRYSLAARGARPSAGRDTAARLALTEKEQQ
jgi:hypothetical protein